MSKPEVKIDFSPIHQIEEAHLEEMSLQELDELNAELSELVPHIRNKQLEINVMITKKTEEEMQKRREHLASHPEEAKLVQSVGGDARERKEERKGWFGTKKP